MFEEEIDGCEFSISSFLIVEYQGKPVAAFGGWIETMNEDETASKLLKSNLISYTFGREALEFLKTKASVISELVTEREPFALQLEYLYVDAGHRGKNLSALLIDALEKRAIAMYPALKKIQVQVYSNNIPAITIYKKTGFEIASTSKSNHPEVLEFLPWNEKYIMQKTIK
jgi:ribosomal protein S18 acetylase RimI-like enzyme